MLQLNTKEVVIWANNYGRNDMLANRWRREKQETVPACGPAQETVESDYSRNLYVGAVLVSFLIARTKCLTRTT